MVYSPKLIKKNIIYLDNSIIIFNKPYNFLSVQGRGFKGLNCLSLTLKKLFPEIFIVHRLDMATSGLIIFARNKDSQIHLCTQFQNREIKKEYIAVVHGHIRGDDYIILPIIPDINNRPKQKICYSNGKHSITRYKSLKFNEKDNSTRVLLEPYTGRTHQLRIHMKYSGHTIIGDGLYSSQKNTHRRLMLHSSRIKFQHPVTNGVLELESAPDF